MRLTDFVLEEAIIRELRATSKPEVLAELVRAIIAAGCLKEQEADSVVTALLEREEIGSTGIGNGLAIPHVKHHAIGRLVGAFGHSSAGVPYDALDGEPARVFFLILWPVGVIGPHLEAIAQISKLLTHPDVLARLKMSSTKEEVLALFDQLDDSPGRAY